MYRNDSKTLIRVQRPIGAGALISSLVAVILILLVGGVYSCLAVMLGTLGGAGVKSVKVLDENSGKINQCSEKRMKIKMKFTSFLKLINSNNLQTHSCTSIKR